MMRWDYFGYGTVFLKRLGVATCNHRVIFLVPEEMGLLSIVHKDMDVLAGHIGSHPIGGGEMLVACMDQTMLFWLCRLS